MENQSKRLVTVSAKIDPQVKQLLIDYADRLGITLSEALNDIIGRYIMRQSQEPTTKAPPFTEEDLQEEVGILEESPHYKPKEGEPKERKGGGQMRDDGYTYEDCLGFLDRAKHIPLGRKDEIERLLRNVEASIRWSHNLTREEKDDLKERLSRWKDSRPHTPSG